MTNFQKWWLGLLTIVVSILLIAVISAFLNGISYRDNTASVLISALGVMVTALVGWQVYNAISYDKRISDIEEIAKKNVLYGDARICFTQGMLIYTVTSSNQNIKAQHASDNYCIAYRHFLESLIKHQGSKREFQPILSCCNNLDKCLKNVEDSNNKFHSSSYKKCDELYNDFLFREKELRVSHEMLTRLSDLHDRRMKLVH